jgi:hypothetical protein
MLLALALAVPLQAQQPAGGGAIAPLVDDQTIAVLHVDLNRLDATKLIHLMGKMAGMPPKDLEASEKQVGEVIDAFKGQGVREVYGIISMEDIPLEPLILATPAQGADTGNTKIANLVKKLAPMAEVRVVRGFLVAGQKNTIQRLQARKPQANPLLAQALATLGKSDAQLVVVVPPALRRSLQEVAPQLPKEFGAMKTAPLVEAFRWAAVGLSLKPDLNLQATVQATSPEAAQTLEKAIGELFARVKKLVPEKDLEPLVDKAIEVLRPKVEKDQLIVHVPQQNVAQLLGPAIYKMRVAAARMQSANNLRQIGVALHNYHELYKKFPAQANYDKNGKPLLSWRVHILPFVEAKELYDQFKLDEPWDSPHNKKLIAHMPPTYRHPASKAPKGKTIYLAPIGPSTIFAKTPTKITEIKDGTSNTILLVEVADDKAVFWTKPDDLPIDPKVPLRGLGDFPPGIFQALFADASVRSLSRKIDPRVLNAMYTKDGNEVIPPCGP